MDARAVITLLEGLEQALSDDTFPQSLREDMLLHVYKFLTVYYNYPVKAEHAD